MKKAALTRRVGLIIYSVLLWAFFLGSSIVMCPLAVVLWFLTRWFDRRLIILHMFSCIWGSLYVWFNPLWHVRVEGRKKLPWKKSAVLVSNHQSMVDIVVLYRLFTPFKWVSKSENFRIPFVGWVMRLNDYIEIHRGSMESYKKLTKKAARFLDQGSPIMIFPEGTRFPGEGMGPFKDGAFIMAHDNRADIIPVVLEGSARALPKKGAILTGYSRISISIMDPIPYEKFSQNSPRETRAMVRGLMSEELSRMQQIKG